MTRQMFWTPVKKHATQAGVTVPLHSCEHMYIVTERIEGVEHGGGRGVKCHGRAP